MPSRSDLRMRAVKKRGAMTPKENAARSQFENSVENRWIASGSLITVG